MSDDIEQRMLNTGTEVETKKLGKVVVKEITIEAIPVVSTELIAILKSVQDDEVTEDGMQWLKGIMLKENFIPALKKILGAVTEKDASDFDALGLSDFVKLVHAFFKENPREQLADVFSQVTAMFQEAAPSVT